MAVMPAVSRGSVLVGAAVGLVTTVASIVAWRVLRATAVVPNDSRVIFAFYALVLVGWVVSGFVAARRELQSPLTHGALAGLAAFVPVAVYLLIAALVRGRPAAVFQVVSNIMIAITMGIVGAALAARRSAT